MERRLAAIMFADLVGYSRLMGEDELRTIAAIQELKTKSLEPLVLKHGGEILKRMGDGWALCFSSASAAMECAMEVQEELQGDPVLRLRIGASIGELTFDGNDFHGAGVNIAKRLESEAPPGGVMISQDLQRMLTGPLAEAFSDAGAFKLKNIALPVNGYQWRPSGAGLDAGRVPSIAVEPFSHAPDDSETRAAVTDLRDEIILRLSRRTGVEVLDQLAGDTGEAVYLLRGRLRTAGGQGRLQLSLLLRDEAKPRWSQVYEGDTSDIFAFTDMLIERADADLRLQINAFDGERVANLPVDRLSVSELRARAASNFYKGRVEANQEAVTLLQRALSMKPDDPMSLAMLSEAQTMMIACLFGAYDTEAQEFLLSCSDKAIEGLPRSDYCFFARAEVKAYALGDGEGALKDAERSLALTSTYVLGLEIKGCALMLMGRFEEALEPLALAIQGSISDPLLPYRAYFHAVAAYCAGKPQEALNSVEQALSAQPNQRALELLRAHCLEALGDEEGRQAALARADRLPRQASIFTPRPALPPEWRDFAESLNPTV
jgi:class 3 adenylate cyclase